MTTTASAIMEAQKSAPATLERPGAGHGGRSSMPVRDRTLAVREYHAGRALCLCGCGDPAPLATENDRANGLVKGRARSFVNGHQTRIRGDKAKAFWARVDIRAEDECWPWTAARNRGGYGTINAGTYGESKAHRLAYRLTEGPIPEGLLVRHTCDNPPCCNPAHLLAGTDADNVRDMQERGRKASTAGENSPRAKLSQTEVDAIRASTERAALIAQRFGISTSHVNAIRARRTWR